MFLSTKTKKKWSSLYKTVVWAASLSIAALSGFSWLGIAVFLFASLWGYFSSSKKRTRFRATYTTLSLFSVISLVLQTGASDSLISSSWVSAVLILIFSTILFFIFEIIKEKILNEELVYKVINTLIFIIVFISLLSLAAPFSLGVFALLVFLFVSLLLNEVLMPLGLSSKRRVAISLTAGFLSVETAWVILLLPISILNGAALITLFICVIRDFIISHIEGRLTPSFVFQELTFLVLVTIIIFASSNWGL